MNWLQRVLALMQLAPKLLELISGVEAAMGPGNGALKKAIVLAPLEGAPPVLIEAAGKFVDTVVQKTKEVPALPAVHAPVTALKPQV